MAGIAASSGTAAVERVPTVHTSARIHVPVMVSSVRIHVPVMVPSARIRVSVIASAVGTMSVQINMIPVAFMAMCSAGTVSHT